MTPRLPEHLWREAAAFRRIGHGTDQIAKSLRVSEAAVANALPMIRKLLPLRERALNAKEIFPCPPT